MTNVISKVIHNWTEYEFNGVNGWVTSVNGNTWAVTVNDVKVSASAPSNPTEWMAWYDTTNDALKVYDGSNWIQTWAVTSVNGNTWAVTVNEVPAWWTDGQVLSKVSGSVAWTNPNTKIFTLSSLSDLTTAQAAYNFKESWWSPILVLNWMYFYYYNNNKFFYVDGQWPNTSWNWLQWRVLSLTVSSWTVTSVSSISNTIRVATSAPSSIFDNECITFVI